MRINKFFTEQGFCSRREADRLIQAGRVSINDRLAVLGDQVAESDVVTLDGKVIKFDPPPIYIMYNKPVGITCTTDLAIKGNIVEAVKHPQRIFPIGRLDKDSHGLIFLTNDGNIVNQILRAQFGHEKQYIVQVDRPYKEEFLFKMGSGVDIGGYVTLPCRVESLGPKTFCIILTEGKNRQIRRMCLTLGYNVKDLQRVRIMNIRLDDLKIGAWRDFTVDELAGLRHLITQSENVDPGEQEE